MPVLGTSHMYTHVHEGVLPVDKLQLSDYEHDLSTVFAREYNREKGRKGPVFAERYGSAPKRSDKEKRSCLIYIFNNPVEKKLVSRARDDRWNFLAYYDQDYPFSQKVVIRRSRKPLVDAIHFIEHEYRSGRYLRYGLLHRLFAPLEREERERLTDYIIQRYFFFDRKACADLFGSYDKMLKATELTTGKEFDVGEVFAPFSDIPLREMCAIAERYGLTGPGMPLFHLPDDRIEKLSRYLQQSTSASDLQIARFLHR